MPFSSVSKEEYVAEYLKRIGYRGGTTPCLTTLQDLHRYHVGAVPFENLALLEPFFPDLDRDYLFDKIVLNRRGGVCYELNTAFYYLLETMGFDVCHMLALVVPGNDLFMHLVTVVHLPDGDYLADVAYDRFVPPIKLHSNPTFDHGVRYSLVYTGENVAEVVCCFPGMEPERLYTLFLVPCEEEDYMDRFDRIAVREPSFLRDTPFCAIHTPQSTTILREQVLTVERSGRLMYERKVAPGAETERCLKEYFHL